MSLNFNYDIIIIGQQSWDTEIGSNCKNIALELSRTNRVLYVNSPLDRNTLIQSGNDPKILKRINVIKGIEKGLIKIQHNLWNYYPDCKVESLNWIGNHFLFDYFNRKNNKKFAYSIFKAIKELNFKDFILINDNEMFKGFYLKELIKPILSIYYSRDFMLGVDYWKKHGERLEPALIEKSDLCFCNSQYLTDYCLQYNSQSFNVGQGCDVEDFINLAASSPKELKSLDSVIIGYVGALNSFRLNIDIIENIAIHFPEMYVVLVGQEDRNFESSRLHQLPNVLFLGQKMVSELPDYINAFDVCINPQLVNSITIGNYPRKVDEYLVLGKPVVATDTQAMQEFKNYVYLAKNQEDYINLIKVALKEDDVKRKTDRINFAMSHTWENSVNKMRDMIETVLLTTKKDHRNQNKTIPR